MAFLHHLRLWFHIRKCFKAGAKIQNTHFIALYFDHLFHIQAVTEKVHKLKGYPCLSLLRKE